MSATKVSFDQFRAAIGAARPPPTKLIRNDDEVRQMSDVDGLCQWQDGPNNKRVRPKAPLLSSDEARAAHLWVVRAEDVVHAQEQCEFGKTLETGVIKHTNLTGAAPAFCGGELLFLDKQTIVVNGRSGRYGPRSADELRLVVRAFAGSGYGVWSMGFDPDTNRPAPFIGTYPEWVEG